VTGTGSCRSEVLAFWKFLALREKRQVQIFFSPACCSFTTIYLSDPTSSTHPSLLLSSSSPFFLQLRCSINSYQSQWYDFFPGISRRASELPAPSSASCCQNSPFAVTSTLAWNSLLIRTRFFLQAFRSIKNLVPLLDRVLVQRIKPETKTASGIILPESSVKEINEASVLAVGPGGLDKNGNKIPMSVAPGDRVLIPQVSALWRVRPLM
jgi:Co-chaperonin GroES (HSP10)